MHTATILGSLIVSLLLMCGGAAWGQSWHPMGPPGGDVRAMGSDPRQPRRLYLGTADGHIFGSEDAGERWKLLGRVGERLDAVVTAILVDPRDSRVLYASAWIRDPATGGGGVFRSDDGGRTWGLLGIPDQAVRALALAPSNPDRLIAGTLEGIFGSRDSGRNWERISPAGSAELRNLDSIAVDPRDPDVLYAGTFHLPWKSTDGGRNWAAIHTGMIDDSDVMSILVDRTDPERIYASACSGIYRSDDGGALWKKIQGIPYSARRTHVIAQDPADAGVIYAGTTEGLWKTENAGATWRRMTPSIWVINALELPASHPGRVVLGTEALGVMVSDDGGENFRAANEGFHHRQIVSLAFDPYHPGRILAVLAHAPEPVLATDDGGRTWSPLGPGLESIRLQRLFASPDGWWAALRDGGLMRYDAARAVWSRSGELVGAAAAAARSRRLAAVVNDMAFSDTRWFAATEKGLLFSDDRGEQWDLLPLGLMPDLPASSVRVSRDAQSLWVVSLRGLVFSTDGGANWRWRDLPRSAGGALRLDVVPGVVEGEMMVAAANNGLYISCDGGDSWQLSASGLPQVRIEDFAISGDLFVASLQLGGLYVSRNAGRSWDRASGMLGGGYFPAVAAGQAGGTIVAASGSDGLYEVDLGPTTLTAIMPGEGH